MIVVDSLVPLASGGTAELFLAYSQGRRVVVREYGVRIGLPIVSFEFVSYWDSHYRSRPWYAERTAFIDMAVRKLSSVQFPAVGKATAIFCTDA